MIIFNKLANKKYYIDVINKNTQDIEKESCGHSLYHPSCFAHRDMRLNNNYDYLLRCIDRFKTLLSKNNNKLFIISFVSSYQNISLETIKNINERINVKTNNYYLLAFRFIKNKIIKYDIEKSDNIIYCNFYYIGDIGGIFKNNENIIVYKKIIQELFDFDLYDDIQ